MVSLISIRYKLFYLQIIICLRTVKHFQVLESNTDNLIKYQSFAYTVLDDQTVLFQAIQFSISHLFALSLNVKVNKCQTVVFDPLIEPLLGASLRARVDLGAMLMNRFSAFPKGPALQEPHHQIV